MIWRGFHTDRNLAIVVMIIKNDVQTKIETFGSSAGSKLSGSHCVQSEIQAHFHQAVPFHIELVVHQKIVTGKVGQLTLMNFYAFDFCSKFIGPQKRLVIVFFKVGFLFLMI